MWSLVPCNGGDQPYAREMAGGLVEALAQANAHFKECPFVSKERIDLAELERHTGTHYAQPETVTEELWQSLRSLHAIDCTVLLPPNSAEGKTAVGNDGIIFLSDSRAALKGMPDNARAKALLAACGRPRDVRGDVFIGRVSVKPGKVDGTIEGSVGGEAPPQVRGLYIYITMHKYI